MKHTLSVILAAMILSACSSVAMADEFSVLVPLSVGVSEMFGFTLDQYSYDFGVVTPGEGAETVIGIFCKSNHGIVWYMALNADEFASGGDTLASDPNFICAAWSNADPEQAKGSFGIYAAAQPVPTTQDDFYTSTVAEGTDPFVPMALGLYLTIPLGQPSGFYSTNLVLTMHE